MESESLQQNPGRSMVRILFWALVVILGVAQAWRYRFTGSADGISYLEIAEAYLRGDWSNAINAYWSPFYSWLTGVALFVLRPTPFWLLGFQKLINLIIYLISFACFDFFIQNVIRNSKGEQSIDAESGRPITSRRAWMLLGYPLFIWSSLHLISLSNDTPDMLVGAVVYLASALILKIRREPTDLSYLMLGLVMGVGYLSKAVMLPLGLVFIVASLLAAGGSRYALKRVGIVLGTFILVSLPFIVAMSVVKNRFTFGDAGKLNYAWEVDGYKKWIHWQGEEAGSGRPEHATRKVLDSPDVYEFNGPITGTYPPWYDPSYWHEGLRTKVEIKKHLKILRTSAATYLGILKSLHVGQILIVGLLAIFFCGGRKLLLQLRSVLREWALLIPAIVAMGLYALVYTEARYVAPFLVIAIVAIFHGVRLTGEKPERLSVAICTALGCMITMSLCLASLPYLITMGREMFRGDFSLSSQHKNWNIAQGLRRVGVRQGDKIGYIGHTWDQVTWAKLAQVQLCAEITYISSSKHSKSEADAFWAADPLLKQQVINEFARSGATAIVADQIPTESITEEWHPVEETTFFVYSIKRAQGESSITEAR